MAAVAPSRVHTKAPPGSGGAGPRPDPSSPLGLDGVHEPVVTAEFFPDIVIEAAVFSLNLRFGQHAFAKFAVVDVVGCRSPFEGMGRMG